MLLLNDIFGKLRLFLPRKLTSLHMNYFFFTLQCQQIKPSLFFRPLQKIHLQATFLQVTQFLFSVLVYFLIYGISLFYIIITVVVFAMILLGFDSRSPTKRILFSFISFSYFTLLSLVTVLIILLHYMCYILLLLLFLLLSTISGLWNSSLSFF